MNDPRDGGTNLGFEGAYRGPPPPWDIGRPQPALLALARDGELVGRVLDVGCGTGEHALLLARLGHRVVGVDLAPRAIERARSKALERAPAPLHPPGAGIAPPEFLVHDALELGTLGARFDTALDVGLFHVLQPEDRRRYARSLAAAVRPGGGAVVLCWSARNPFGYGPERITRAMLRRSFVAADGWAIESIEPETLETRLDAATVHAWCARLRRRV